jgi:hypothetical protein
MVDFSIIPIQLCLWRFFGNKHRNAQQGFQPRRGGSPRAINPEQVLRHTRYDRRGGMGAQALSAPDRPCAESDEDIVPVQDLHYRFRSIAFLGLTPWLELNPSEW